MKHIVLFFALGLLVTGIHAQDQSGLRKKQFNLNDGIAISGYDPVTYFTLNKPVKGNKENAVAYEGVTYYFSSAANKEEFKKNPGKYEPEYGGWCSYAMGAKGEKVEVDPKTFKIVNGKLNLFYNKFFNNTLTDWNKDEANLKKKADASWTKIYH
ncbi:MAG: YHS domain-containing (seleno)protein [Chitinophagaceae bacterium]